MKITDLEGQVFPLRPNQFNTYQSIISSSTSPILCLHHNLFFIRIRLSCSIVKLNSKLKLALFLGTKVKIKKEPAFENLSLCKSDILTGILNEIKSKNGCRDKKRFVTLLVKENSAFCSGKTLQCAFKQRDSLTHYQSCLYFV